MYARTAPVLAALVAATAGPAAAQPAETLDLVRFRTSAAIGTLPPGDGRCTAPLPDGVRACLADGPDASRSYAIRLAAPGREIGRIVSDYYVPTAVPAFDLARFFDRGAARYALVVRESARVGPSDLYRGLPRWKMYVFEEANALPVLRLATAEHSGAASFPVLRGQVMLRVAAWEDGGEAGYRLVGRTYRYDGGALAPEATAPVVRRSWTDADEQARRAAGADDAAWDWAAGAARTAADPQVAPLRVRTSTPGRLGAVTLRDDGHEQVAFLPDDGSAPALVPVFDLADGPSQRLFPDAYAPRGDWAAYLPGRRARLVTYRIPPSWTDANALLWLDR